ncbi:hypothetical protein [Achromobacter insuavis]|uniref:hypothetical protein n=1 Tax=Achromobacter insuavis TaxID=1287735 RepID=UPI001F141938|nr:hypothetical protein [Achromobacter insuavis]
MTRTETLKALRNEEAALSQRAAEKGNLLAAAHRERNQANIRYLQGVCAQMSSDLAELARRIKEAEAQPE